MTSPPTQTRVCVGTLDELWEGEMLALAVGNRAILLVNVDGQVLAFEDRCPHQATRLSEGTFNGRTLVCSGHEWVFDCGGGGAGINPRGACLLRYAVRVEGDAIFVDVNEVLQQARGLPGLDRRR